MAFIFVYGILIIYFILNIFDLNMILIDDRKIGHLLSH